MKSEILKFALIGFAAILLQILIFNHLSYRHIQPDFTLLVLIWVIATQNRTKSLLFAAFIGILNDFFFDLWGLHLLAKTVTTLLVHSHIPRIEETRIFSTQVFFILLVITLVHNLLFLISALFTQIYEAEPVFFEILLGSSLLTAIIGSIIYLLRQN